MRYAICLTAITFVVLLASGCGKSEPVGGVVGLYEKARVESLAPDIPFTSISGKQRMLHRVSQPIEILAFVSSPGDICCRLEPALVTAASRFRSLPVSVIQVSVPEGQCPHGPGCTETCNIDKGRLISLCDPDRIAWKAYGQAAPDSVFLVGENRRIIQRGTLDSIGPILEKAEALGRAVQKRYEGG